MKKVNYRSIFMAFLMMCSVAAYVFLSTVEVKSPNETAVELNHIDTENADPKVFMPDVELVKKMAAIGKAVLHPFSK